MRKSCSRRFYSVWTPFDISFLRNTEIGKKQQFWAGPPVNRLVPKIIYKWKIKPIIVQNSRKSSMEQSKIIDTLETYQASSSLIPARPRVGK